MPQTRRGALELVRPDGHTFVMAARRPRRSGGRQSPGHDSDCGGGAYNVAELSTRHTHRPAARSRRRRPLGFEVTCGPKDASASLSSSHPGALRSEPSDIQDALLQAALNGPQREWSRRSAGRPRQRWEELLCRIAVFYGWDGAATWTPRKVAGMPTTGSTDGWEKIRLEEARESDPLVGHRSPPDRQPDLRIEEAPPCDGASQDRRGLEYFQPNPTTAERSSIGCAAVSRIARPLWPSRRRSRLELGCLDQIWFCVGQIRPDLGHSWEMSTEF